MSEGYAPARKGIPLLLMIPRLYEQKYMYENQIHVVEKRIISIGQPLLRPIIRGKSENAC